MVNPLVFSNFSRPTLGCVERRKALHDGIKSLHLFKEGLQSVETQSTGAIAFSRCGVWVRLDEKPCYPLR
jgi:hypothetical protein